MTEQYLQFFRGLTGYTPFPYQELLGTETWPELLDIPTGLGKTAAIGIAWLWKRSQGEVGTPRRLVYCLPMRTLVEQTQSEFQKWIAAGVAAGLIPAGSEPKVHLLMGGDSDDQWVRNPERDAVLIGTQDMLLSRALMRGYGLTPYVWPIHFGLLHSDSLWVFDEVQIMGPGVATSAQLEGLRGKFPIAVAPSRSLWCSATISSDWLRTYDLRERAASFTTVRLSADDERQAGTRLQAMKRLTPASTALTKEAAKAKAKDYVRSLAGEIVAAHRPGTRTLIVLNQVARAQELYRHLKKEKSAAEVLLIHSRFRPVERRRKNERLRAEPGPHGTIVVATQVVEAGVDISSAVLFTELAPWSSMVQRWGRCNRYGEQADAEIRWIDIDTSDGDDFVLPYEPEDLDTARTILRGLASAAIVDLPHVDLPAPLTPVLRRRDLLDLFNTDPDLTGFHVDVSQYIRDSDERNVQVFWREIDGKTPAPDEPAPERDELCTTSIPAIAEALKSRTAWRWDALAPAQSRESDDTGRWVAVDSRDIYPGLVLLLSAKAGAYDEEIGFDPTSKTLVVEPPVKKETPEAYGGNHSSLGFWQPLAEHSLEVRDTVRGIAETIGVTQDTRFAMEQAALWHDVGKLHEIFQEDLLRGLPVDDPKRGHVWAKGMPRTRSGRNERRRYFRHELASALAVLAAPVDLPQRNLVAYLAAAHHGKVRLSVRALPGEPPAESIGGRERRFARGIWDGDVLPAFSIPGEIATEEGILTLDLLELGSAASWNRRTRALIDEHGPFLLASLEALVRIADWRASGAAQDRYHQQEEQA